MPGDVGQCQLVLAAFLFVSLFQCAVGSVFLSIGRTYLTGFNFTHR